MKKEENKEQYKHNIDNSCGIVAVIMGILSLLLSSLTGVIMGIIGLAFSIKQDKIAKNKWSKAGFILNIIGIIIGIIVFAVTFYSLSNDPELLAKLQGLSNQ